MCLVKKKKTHFLASSAAKVRIYNALVANEIQARDLWKVFVIESFSSSFSGIRTWWLEL